MPLELKRTRAEIETDIFGIAQEYGFSRTDRFIGSFITSILDQLEENFTGLYDLEPQSRIDTASDEWLASWARTHGQPVEILEGGEDLSFDNVYIGTSDGRPVSDFTLNGQPLFFSAGVSIRNTDGREILISLDNVEISGDRAFVRVAIPSGLSLSVAPGTYPTNISLRDFAIRGLQDVPELVAVVQRSVTGRSLVLSDDDLRSIIFDRARSRNKANGAAVRTVLQLSEIAKVVVKNFNSGSSSVSIYVEPRLGLLSAPLAARIRGYLEDLLPNATRINIGPMIGSLAEFTLRLKLPDGFSTSELDDLKARVRGRVVALLGQTASGESVNFSSLLTTIASEESLPSVNLIDCKVNGKKVALSTYSCRDIEFLYTDELRVEVLA